MATCSELPASYRMYQMRGTEGRPLRGRRARVQRGWRLASRTFRWAIAEAPAVPCALCPVLGSSHQQPCSTS